MPGTSSPSRLRRARLRVVNPRSAGIDIGSRFHVVAVPAELDDDPVRKFSSFTNDLKAMAEWLLAIDIKTVAMESTGIYWVPLYEILVEYGIEVYLVNARHVKNVPGRKTDISDAQWLQQLHSYGLVRASFQPDPCIANSGLTSGKGMFWCVIAPRISNTCRRPSCK